MTVTKPGLDPTNAVDGALDKDGDGLANKHELLYGGSIINTNTDGDAHGKDSTEVNNGTYVNSANDPTGTVVSAKLTIGDPVNNGTNDVPSQRYRMLIWDEAVPDLYFIRHQPMDSFHGYPGEMRTYNQFRPYTWYGVRIEPMAQLCSTNVLDLDYKADIEPASSCYMLDKFDPSHILDRRENCTTNWFDNTARFRFLPRVNVDLDGVNSNGTVVADDDEMDPGPGVALVNGWTKLRIQYPWTNGLPGTNFGTYTLSWTDPSNKWVKLNNLASPISIPCTSPDWPSHRGWPTNFIVTRSTNWVDWLDSVVVRLTHSISTELKTLISNGPTL